MPGSPRRAQRWVSKAERVRIAAPSLTPVDRASSARPPLAHAPRSAVARSNLAAEGCERLDADAVALDSTSMRWLRRRRGAPVRPRYEQRFEEPRRIAVADWELLEGVEALLGPYGGPEQGPYGGPGQGPYGAYQPAESGGVITITNGVATVADLRALVEERGASPGCSVSSSGTTTRAFPSMCTSETVTAKPLSRPVPRTRRPPIA